MFAPRFEIIPAIARALMSIEADRQAIQELPVDVEMLASLRETARLVATHYSTQIEGNRLTLPQVEEALSGARFPGRERDEVEVRNYYRALEEVERLAKVAGAITEEDIQKLHSLVMHGKGSPSPYRDGQNVINDSATRRIVYMPPEAKDVPALMAELVKWVAASLESGELPVPIIAALAHYQFATIHPYYDGNGRTARLLTTLILHRAGYGLKGIYSLEEHYAQNLEGYYSALSVGESHNYYLGRVEGSMTPFVSYFCAGMAEALAAVKAQAQKAARQGRSDQSPLLRSLDPRQRRALALFQRQSVASTQELADALSLGARTMLPLCRRWVEAGFLEVADPSKKARSYQLASRYESLIALR
jgi:Fic family protein